MTSEISLPTGRGGLKIDTKDTTYYSYKEIGQPDEENIRIFICDSIAKRILKGSKNPVYPKTFGLLLGSKIQKGDGFIIHINESMPLGRLKVHGNPKALSQKSWETVQNKVYNLYSGMSILGWYGLRNGWEAMLTHQDRAIHNEHFIKSWQVIYLLDGSNGSSNFFCWDGDKLKPSGGYYEYRDEDISESAKNKLGNQKKLIIGLIGAIIIILTVYLSGQYGEGYFSPKDNQNIAGDVQPENTGDNLGDNYGNGNDRGNETAPGQDTSEKQGSAQSDHAQDGVIRAGEDGPNHTVEDYQAALVDLESKLKGKQQKIENLEQVVESLEKETKGLDEEIKDIIQEIEEKEAADKLDEGLSDGADIYVIQSGDNLYKISQRFYGTDRYSRALAKANRIKDQKALVVGDYLVIPSIEEVEKWD